VCLLVLARLPRGLRWPRVVVPAVLVAVTGAVVASGWGQSRPQPGVPSAAAATATPSQPPATPSQPPATQSARPAAQLPRGGRALFPRYRLVGYSGGDGSAAFGRLGTGDLDRRVDEIERLGTRYRRGRDVMPVLELIAVIAHPRPAADGRYRIRVDDAVIERYLAAARRHRALLLLNIQPGRADFLAEVKALRPWLEQPDVGVALDPEWAVRPGQVPGQVFGSTDGTELDRVAAYLAGIVSRERLPQKAMIVHQLAPRVVRDIGALKRRKQVAVVKSVDGIGAPADKTATWRRLVRGMPTGVHPGFKLFHDEDTRSGPLMTPKQVLALRPTPEYVLYE
jgi:hypothetical protein